MNTITHTNNKQRLITFSNDLYEIGKNKAKKLGLTFTEYVRFLLVSDIKEDVERNNIYPMVDEETEIRIGESLEALENGNYTTLNTAEELKKHLKNL